MKKWEEDECAKRVATDESPELGFDEEWTVELLLLYLKAKQLDQEISLYYWKEAWLRNGEHVIFLVRTRAEQRTTGCKHRLDILEKSVKVGGNYIPGEKVSFFLAYTLWRERVMVKIDWPNLPAYNSMSQYDEKYYVPYHQMSFHPVQHLGSCGYMALAKSLGLPSWKAIFQKLVDVDYFKCKVTIPDDDSLDSKYWLNVDSRKYSRNLLCY